jgi:hypothetical protein
VVRRFPSAVLSPEHQPHRASPTYPTRSSTVNGSALSPPLYRYHFHNRRIEQHKGDGVDPSPGRSTLPDPYKREATNPSSIHTSQGEEGSPLRLAAAASLLRLLLVVLFLAPPPDNQSRRCIPTGCKRTYKQSAHQCLTAGNPRIRWLLVLVIDLGLDGRGKLFVRATMASKAGARQPVAEACTR